MIIPMIIGFLIFAAVLIKDPKVLRVNIGVVKNFLLGMVFLTFFRIFLFSFLENKFGISISDVNQGFMRVPFWRLALVFWEDAFFAIPIYYMADKWRLKESIWLPIAAALSICFAQGHMYQFELAYFGVLAVPFLVFYRYGKRYGFGTTMICHILFDTITLLTFKLMSLMVL